MKFPWCYYLNINNTTRNLRMNTGVKLKYSGMATGKIADNFTLFYSVKYETFYFLPMMHIIFYFKKIYKYKVVLLLFKILKSMFVLPYFPSVNIAYSRCADCFPRENLSVHWVSSGLYRILPEECIFLQFISIKVFSNDFSRSITR